MSGDLEDLIVITDPGTDRYHTFSFISWWKPEIVRNARVMVVGAGALGNEVLKNLALMGIGEIFIADFDTIEDANLSRSVLFRPEDNGLRKSEVAAARVRQLNPDVKTQYFHGDINYELGLGVFRRMNCVIGCLDNRAARLSINRFCWHINMPWVDGAIQELLGEARTFVPNRGACYECTLNDEDYKIINLRFSCPLLARNDILQGKVPTTPTIASIIGGIQTQEALKLLHEMEVTAGHALVFNGLGNSVYLTELPVKQDCQSHWLWNDIVELPGCSANVTTVGELLSIVRESMGPDAILELSGGLERDIVTALVCPTCNTREEIVRSQHRVSVEEGTCPTCGQMREPILSHSITGTEPFLDKTLAGIGIPPLDIIPARQGLTYRYFELTGDASSFFSYQ